MTLVKADTNEKTQHLLIIGLGNPILGDDGVGWCIADEIQKRLSKKPLDNDSPIKVEITKLSLGGLSLMEAMIGYDKVILIDAVTTGKKPIGTITISSIDELPNQNLGHLSSAHDTSLQHALRIGKSLGAKLPDQIIIVGIEAIMDYDFKEELSEPIKASIPEATRTILEMIS